MASAILDALSEPAAVVEGEAVATNAAWSAQGLPDGAEAVHATFVAAPRPDPRARFETAWGLAEVAPLGEAWLVRIVRSIDPRAVLEASDYRAVFEVSADGIFVYDDAYRLVDVNPAACAHHGWTRAQMLAMDPTEFIDPSAHGVFAEFVETLRTESSFKGLARGLRSDGSTFDVEVRGVPLYIRGRRHYLGSIHDITHLREATREAARNGARVRRALEASGAAYWEVDLRSGERFASERCAALFGQPIDDIEGWLAVGDADDGARLRNAWQSHLAGEVPRVRCERRVVDGDTVRWLAESAEIFERDDDGRPLLVAGSAWDVSARKQLEERLMQGSRLESLGRMAGGIAHDFNNLLTVILTGVGLAQAARPEGDEDLDDVRDAAERARRLTDQLLTFSRHQVLSPRQLDLEIEITAASQMLRRLLGPGVGLELEFCPGLWTVSLDPSQLEQVLCNLAVNASDAMPDGGRFLVELDNVHLDASYIAAHPGASVGPYVRLSVTDTGAGMTADVVGRIFEPFFTTKPRGQGTGLGLATVYGIVQQSGGHLWVYSEPGTGTSFRIYLPRSSDADGELPVETRDGDIELAGTERVLVVEDDDAVRKIAVAALERHGYAVTAAASGADAIERFAEQGGAFDLVLTDVMLGDTDGHTMGERLRVGHPALRVLFVSGYTENTIVKGGILKPGVAFLPKPYAPHELLRAVRRVLDGGRSG